MNSLRLFLLVLLVNPGFALAIENLSGIWTGSGFQDNGATWTIKFSITEGKYIIDYPSIPCSGFLTLLSQSGNEYIFKEKITLFKQNCIDNGKVIIHIVDTNTLNWQWLYPNGKAGASTTLKKQSKDQPENKKHIPLLAIINNFSVDVSII